MDEFFRLYPTIKNDYPDKAFDRLCYLLGRTLTQKREITEDITEKKIVFIYEGWKSPDAARSNV